MGISRVELERAVAEGGYTMYIQIGPEDLELLGADDREYLLRSADGLVSKDSMLELLRIAIQVIQSRPF